jgi:hypothetical protein
MKQKKGNKGMNEDMNKIEPWGQVYSPKAEITVPRVTKDLLIFAPSFNLSPVKPVASALSLWQNSIIPNIRLKLSYWFIHT